MSIVAKLLNGWRCPVLGIEIDLGPSHFVLDGDPAPPSSHERGTAALPLFGPCLLWPQSPISATSELLLTKLHPKISWLHFYGPQCSSSSSSSNDPCRGNIRCFSVHVLASYSIYQRFIFDFSFLLDSIFSIKFLSYTSKNGHIMVSLVAMSEWRPPVLSGYGRPME